MIGAAIVWIGACAAEPGPLSVEFLRLPAYLHVEAEASQQGIDEPYMRLTVDESLTSAAAVQSSHEGSIGWVVSDLTFADETQTIIYDVRKKQAVRSNRFGAMGSVRIDGVVTPIGWVRRAAFASTHAGSVESKTRPDGMVEVRVKPGTGGGEEFWCLIDPVSHELRETHLQAGNRELLYTYRDWVDLEGGSHAPEVVEAIFPAVQSMPADIHSTTRAMVVRTTDANAIFAPTLPPDAMIDDRIDGTRHLADGRALAAPPPPPPAPSQDSFGLWRTILVALGAGIVGVGIALKLTKRA